jgi:uncharacterized UPF0146 family protein
MLIVQDIVVIMVMIALASMGGGDANAELGYELAGVFTRGLLFLVIVGLLMRFVLPRLLAMLAFSQEMLMLFAISWAVALGAVGEAVGFSMEVGAFVAGVSLASTRYREMIGARLVSLRDFLLLFFFIDLGSSLDLGLLQEQIGPAAVLSLFVLIGNPLIVMVIIGALGYTKRTGFLTGLTVAQISEFSLLFAALGLQVGHIERDTVGLITLVGLITIGLSTYLILYSHQIYRWLAPHLGVFEFRKGHVDRLADGGTEADTDVILFGLGRFGSSIAEDLRERGVRVLAVDFDPEVVRSEGEAGHAIVYGDADDPEFLATLPLERAKWVASTLPQRDLNLSLIQSLKHLQFEGRLAVTAHHEDDAQAFRERGADDVLLPFRDAASEAADRLARERTLS